MISSCCCSNSYFFFVCTTFGFVEHTVVVTPIQISVTGSNTNKFRKTKLKNKNPLRRIFSQDLVCPSRGQNPIVNWKNILAPCNYAGECLQKKCGWIRPTNCNWFSGQSSAPICPVNARVWANHRNSEQCFDNIYTIFWFHFQIPMVFYFWNWSELFFPLCHHSDLSNQN